MEWWNWIRGDLMDKWSRSGEKQLILCGEGSSFHFVLVTMKTDATREKEETHVIQFACSPVGQLLARSNNDDRSVPYILRFPCNFFSFLLYSYFFFFFTFFHFFCRETYLFFELLGGNEQATAVLLGEHKLN